MNITKIKNELTNKTKNELQKYQFIGAEIKHCRIKLSKTLDSIANVNKSISYISKIENNRIVPNESSLMELCNELSISPEDLENMNNFDEMLIKVLDAIYRNDNILIEETFKKYEIFNNIRTQLMKGIYYISIEDYKNLDDTVNQLCKVESCLCLDDYLIYVLLSVKNLIYKKENLQAYKVVKLINETALGCKEITRLFKMIQYDLKLNFGLSTFHSDYNSMINMHMNYMNYEQMQKLAFKYNFKCLQLADIDNVLDLTKCITDNDLLCYAYCKIGDLDEATKYFNTKIDFKIKLMYLYKSNKIAEIEEIIKADNIGQEILILAMYYKMLLTADDNQLKDFIVNSCFPYFYKTCDVNMLLIIHETIVNINSKYSKYKETSSLSLKLSNLILDITKNLL